MTHRDKVGKTEPPDEGWGWVVAFAAFMVHFIIDGVTYSFGVLYIEFLSYFNEGAAATSWIASILVGVTFCSGPISSILINKYGCRAVAIIGSVLSATSMILSIFATNILTLYFTIGVGTGLGFGLIFVPAIVSVTCWFGRKRALATGIAVSGSGIGTFIFSPLTTWLLSEYGWRGTLLLIAGIVLHCTIFGALFRPVYNTTPKTDLTTGVSAPMIPCKDHNTFEFETQSSGCINVPSGGQLQQQQLQSEPLSNSSGAVIISSDMHHTDSPNSLHKQKRTCAEVDENSAPLMEGQDGKIYEESEPESRPDVDLSLLKDPIFIIFTLSGLFSQMGMNIPYVYIVAQADSMKVPNADLLLSVIGIANTMGRVLIGYLCDKTSARNRLWVYNGCLIVCGIATALSAFCNSFMLFAVYGSVFGLLIGGCVNLTSVILTDLLGLDRITNAFGTILLFVGFAALVGPPIAGRLYDATSSYDPGFVVAGVVIALSGVVMFLIPVVERRARNKSPSS